MSAERERLEGQVRHWQQTAENEARAHWETKDELKRVEAQRDAIAEVLAEKEALRQAARGVVDYLDGLVSSAVWEKSHARKNLLAALDGGSS